MNTIEFIEKVTLDNAEYLQPEDRFFCEKTYAAYNDHFTLFSNILNEVIFKFENHKNDYPNFGPFNHELNSFSEAMDEIKSATKSLTLKFATTITNYFNTEYSLGINVDLIAGKERKLPLASYQAIIDDIVEQVGTDFRAKGELRIIERFKSIFSHASRQPVLHGCKISFPTIGSYDVGSFDHHITLRDSRESISKVLDAIALFALNTIKRPASFSTQFQEWRRDIDCKIDYNLLGGDQDVSIKFFRNQRIDLIWLKKENALNFWKKFDLENITKRNENGHTS